MKIKIISTAVSAAMMCGIMAQLGVAAINESPYDVTEVYLNHYDNIETSVFEPQLMNGSLTYGDFVYSVKNGEATILKYQGTDGNVVIPSIIDDYPVTAIGSGYGYGFYGNKNIVSVTIPDGVISIAAAAFYNCDNLSEVILPQSLEYIGSQAFYSCENLTDINLPSNLLEINSEAFKNCSAIKKFVIPEGVTVIKSSTFSGCTALRSVQLPTSLTAIEKNAFNSCENISEINLSKNISNIDTGAFANCSLLEKIEIPNGIETLSSEIFANCYNLKSVIIPDSVKVIDEFAFYQCKSLEQITIPSSVTTIKQRAFQGCKSLTSILIPDSVILIDSGAFYDCSTLENLYLSSNISSINEYLFYGCSSLKTVIVPPKVTTINDYAFKNCKNAIIFYPEDVVINPGIWGTSNAFNNVIGKVEYLVDNDISSIIEVTTSLDEITIPGNIYGYPVADFVAQFNGRVNHTHYPSAEDCVICPKVATPMEKFVERLYTVILNRNSDSDGKNNHVSNLENGESACKVAYDFIFSSEFLNSGLSNEEVVAKMYRVFLDREPDAGSKTWVDALNSGCSYAAVMYGVSQSNEFTELCDKYGIVRGNFAVTENRDQSANLTAFVNRLYNKTLGRNGEPEGLNSHTGAYLQNRNVEQLAYNFVFSPEFTNKNHSNEEFVEIMYQAFFGRDSDPTGREHWLSVLANGGSRYDVFLGFIGSQECKELVESFGI